MKTTGALTALCAVLLFALAYVCMGVAQLDRRVSDSETRLLQRIEELEHQFVIARDGVW